MRALSLRQGAREARRQFVWLDRHGRLERGLSESTDQSVAKPLVIDPNKETIVLRWVGGATVSQLVNLFGQGERALRGGRGGAEERRSRAPYGAGKYGEAAGMPRRPQALPAGSPEYARQSGAAFSLQVANARPSA
jgi:hypothetical protein